MPVITIEDILNTPFIEADINEFEDENDELL